MELSILLLEPPRPPSSAHFNDVANTPLSSCLLSGYISSMLKSRGFHTEIYDAFLSRDSFRECSKKLETLRFDILGVNAVYLWEKTDELFLFLHNFTENHKQLPVILYGFFPTFSYREILQRYPFIDCIIRGEPEETFADIAADHAQYGSIAFEKIPGLAFRENGEVKVTGSRALTDPLDVLPFPDRSELFLKKIGGNILASRGCYGNCVFCCINNFYGEGCCWRGRSPGNIAQEIELIIPRLPEPYIYFVDANFFGTGAEGRTRSVAIFESIKNRPQLEFGIECRCNDLDEEMVSLMVSAGLRHVFLGIESASPASLKRMRKGIDRKKSEEAVKLLKSHGIEPNPGFIMFEPDSTLEDVRANFEFLKANQLLDVLSGTANVLYHREIVLRGTHHFKLLEKQQRIEFRDPLGYEGHYRFSHKPVQFLADLMAQVCRDLFTLMQNRQSPLFWKKGQTRASLRVNDFLVYMFGEVLRRLELQEMRGDNDDRLTWEKHASDVIEGLIVSERVCQL